MRSTTCRTGQSQSHQAVLYILHARYDFIHDQRLPDVEGRSAREQKVLEKEMSRVDKWLVMIKEKDKWLNSKKLSERVWKVN